MRRLAGWSVSVAALCLFAASCEEEPISPYLEGSPRHYVNPQYGVDVAIPKDLDVCVQENAFYMSHGFTIPLTGDPRCKSPNPAALPHINIYFNYGAIYDEPPTIDDLADRECGDALKRVEVPELSLPGYSTLVCRGPYENKYADLTAAKNLIHTALMAWVPWSSGARGVFFQISLVTTESRLTQDTETLKLVLQGVKLAERKDQ